MFCTVREIPDSGTIKNTIKVSAELGARRKDAIDLIRAILRGEDKHKLLIVGPCSADNERAVCDYACRLASVAEQIKDKIYVVMRVYTAKPRSRGEGYMGLMHTPDYSAGVTDICRGIEAARRLHIAVAESSGLFTADELLYPDAAQYTDDIVCYYSVGARSSDDPLHRFAASGADVPVGIKNGMNGNLFDLAAGVRVAKSQNEFLYCGAHTRTSGNPFAHAVLRGEMSRLGEHIGNYDYDSVMNYVKLSGGERVIIDVGHSNSGKTATKQVDVLSDVLYAASNNSDYNKAVAGFMLESYIEGGCGESAIYGRSVTDDCLSFDDTKRLIFAVADKIVT